MVEQQGKTTLQSAVNWSTSEQGQDLVEFALILPLLLLLLLGIVEFGIAVFDYNSIANVSREVARYGSVHPKLDDLDDFVFTDDQKTTYTEEVRRWTQGLISDTGTLSITYSFAGSDVLSSTVHVTVTYAHQFLTGPVVLALGGNSDLDLRAVSSMNTERPVK